jgi:hypothetical protein
MLVVAARLKPVLAHEPLLRNAPSYRNTVTPQLLLHVFMAPSWTRPADGAGLSLAHDGTFEVSPQGPGVGSDFMRIWHLCYAALGIAVARWVFKRQPMAVRDPITRFRTLGLL